MPMFLRPACLALVISALAGCTHPAPGFNPEASAAQAQIDVPLRTKPTVGNELAAVMSNKVEVPFNKGSSTLSGEADKQLDIAARLFRDASPSLMFVTGNADNSGDEFKNLLLSAKRAQTVKKALASRGIPAEKMLLQALGTSNPKSASTPDANDNRRVVVQWRLS